MNRTWAWFDALGNFQAAGFLTLILLGMGAAATCLLVGSASLRPVAVASIPAAPEPPVLLANVDSNKPAYSDATHVRVVTVAPSVNLRAEPSTAAVPVTTLARHTELELVGDDEISSGTLWRHVRTDEGREGWVIGTALVLEGG
jgi:hypothetical protein